MTQLIYSSSEIERIILKGGKSISLLNVSRLLKAIEEGKDLQSKAGKFSKERWADRISVSLFDIISYPENFRVKPDES